MFRKSKKFIAMALAVAMMMGMSTSVFAVEGINIHPNNYSAEQIGEIIAQPIDGIATPNGEHPTPYIESDGTFMFSYTSQSGGGAGHILSSDRFKLTSTSAKISMNVTAKDTANSGETMTLTLKGKGCGLFGKKISWKADGIWAGYVFTGLTTGEKYYFDLNSNFYCSGTGDITNFDAVV